MRQLVTVAVCCTGFALAAATGKVDPKAPAKGVKTPGVQIPFASLKAEAEVPLEGPPAALLVAPPNLIAPNGTKVDRIEGRGAKLSEKPAAAGMRSACGGAVSAFDSIWIPDCGAQSIQRVDLKAGKIARSLETGTPKQPAAPVIAANPDSIWILSDSLTTLSRIDPEDNAVVAAIRLPEQCSALAFGESALWVACPKINKVLRLDPKTNAVAKTIETAAKPVAIAFGEGSVWVLGEQEGKISRIDPKTNTVSATIDLAVPAAGGGSLVYGEGYLWVSMPGFPLTKVAAEGNKIVQQFFGPGLGGGPLATGFGSVWLAQGNKILRFDPKRIAATLAEE